MLKRLGTNGAVQLAGMETAAIPLLTAVLMEGRSRGVALSGLIVRKERKPWGLGCAIEGMLSGDPVVIIDDILNSGTSAEKARVTLEQAGARVERMLVVIDYQSEEGLAWRQHHGIEVESLFTLADFGLSLSKPAAAVPQNQYSKLWEYKAKGGRPYHVVPKSAPLLVGERLFFGTDGGSMRALDITTGGEVWKYQCKNTGRKGVWSSAAHHAGRLYFGAYNGSVYCLDATTGTLVWRRPLCEWVGSSPLIVPEHGLLYIGLEYERPRARGSFAALRLQNGEKVWEHWLEAYQHGSGGYWKGGDFVVFGTNDHDVRALRARTGEAVWTFKACGSVKYAPAIDEARSLVAFASFNRSIYVLDARDGRKLGEFATDDICYTTPLITGNRLFCGSGDRHLFVIDLDQMTLVKKIDCGARIYSSPRLIDGAVVFGTAGGVVRELDPVSLETRAKLVVPDAVTNAVAATPDGTRIFVPTYINEIFAFRREQSQEVCGDHVSRQRRSADGHDLLVYAEEHPV